MVVPWQKTARSNQNPARISLDLTRSHRIGEDLARSKEISPDRCDLNLEIWTVVIPLVRTDLDGCCCDGLWIFYGSGDFGLQIRKFKEFEVDVVMGGGDVSSR
uniref:Uncharacterized protein n=1 Tax=Fagus sylvatica TaxID=28930 RepID=A0A2N9HEW0_FAGSY